MYVRFTCTVDSKGFLFIFSGNICRSPIAEAVFLDLLKKKGDLANVGRPRTEILRIIDLVSN